MKIMLTILQGPAALRIFALITFVVAGATSLAICYVLKHVISMHAA